MFFKYYVLSFSPFVIIHFYISFYVFGLISKWSFALLDVDFTVLFIFCHLRHEMYINILFMCCRLSHENILRLLGYSEDGECICLVYPYMSNGSLEDCLACKVN